VNRRIVIVLSILVVLVLAGTLIHAWPTSHPKRTASHHHDTPTAVTICRQLAVASGTDLANATVIRKLASPSLAASLISDASHDPTGSAPAPPMTVVASGPNTAVEHLPGGVTLTCTVSHGKVVSLR